MGRFTGPSEQYGVPLSFIHPKDNDFAKARFNPILLDPRWKLTDQQRRDLQTKADDLARMMLYAGEEYGGGRKPQSPREKRQAQRS